MNFTVTNNQITDLLGTLTVAGLIAGVIVDVMLARGVYQSALHRTASTGRCPLVRALSCTFMRQQAR